MGDRNVHRVRAEPRRPVAPTVQELQPRRRAVVQAKLQVGSSRDPFEVEADAFAQDVMRRIAESQHATARDDDRPGVDPGRIRRMAHHETAAPEVGLDGGDLSEGTEREIRSASSGGSPLPASVQASMGAAIGADLSSVRVHTNQESADLNRRIGATAFTTGSHIHFSEGAYQPGSADGQHLLAHELAHTLQQGKIRRRASASEAIIYRYADVPTYDQWKADSKVARTKRSDLFKSIDDAVDAFNKLKSSDDQLAKRTALHHINSAIWTWQTEKDKQKDPSVRQAFVDDLKTVVDAKIKENSDAHELQLSPLIAELDSAWTKGDFAEGRQKAAVLEKQHTELYMKTVAAALKTTNRTKWATAFFTAPATAVGANPIHPSTIKAIADYRWMTKKIADEAIDFVVMFANDTGGNQILQMLQYAPFRQGLKAKATPEKYAEVEAKMPLLRVASAAEDDVATKGATPSINDVADSVFKAFLDDQPITGLGYATNSVQFKTASFLIGDTVGAQRAPCMSLSNVLTEVFKAVLPQGVPGAYPEQDMRPMLTKPLASIGTGGILTRETSFHGNVEQFGTTNGYAAVNRIFFGDGHEWLVVGNKEYCPTLGISGPRGTMAAQLEPLTFTKKGEKYKSSDGKTVTRNKKVPPGGGKMLFQRSVVIK